MRSRFRHTVFIGSSLALTMMLTPDARGQTALPQITVETTNKKPPKRPTARRRTPTPTTVTAAPAQPPQVPNRPRGGH